MPVGGSIAAAGSLGSAFIGASGAKSAGKAMSEAAARAQAQQMQMFQEAKAGFKPWLDVGGGANYQLGQLYGLPDANGQVKPPDYSGFANSPDMKFAEQQGNLGVSRYLNATGQAQGGGAMKEIANYNQGLATQNFGNYFQRLLSLSGLGAQAAGQQGQMAGQFSGQIGNSIMAGGQAQASGIMGQANAWAGGLSGAANAFAMPSYMSKMGQMRQGGNPSSYSSGLPGGGSGDPWGSTYQMGQMVPTV